MKEVDPKETSRAQAFELWMKSPMPMVTIIKTFDVKHLVKVARRKGLKFNMLMCWCVGKAASGIPEFYLLPRDGKLWQYDKLAVNIVVTNRNEGICNCDVPYSDDLTQFNDDYLKITRQAWEKGENISLSDEYNIVGTSALTDCYIDAAINQYSGIYNNPFAVWGQYRKGFFKTTLPISFQFHHAQMDGGHATRFLNTLQEVINEV